MKHVLVTGGTGCVGANLAERLVGLGCDVRILRREKSDLRAIEGIGVEHYIGDVRDRASLHRAMEGCDTVFHTAAIVTFEAAQADVQYEVNVAGTRNVVDAALDAGVERFVHTSSVAAIGYPPDGELATEETPFNWSMRKGYKFSKHKAEEEIFAGVHRGLHAVIVNPSVIVGERDIHFHGGDILRRVKKWQVPFYIEGGMNIVYVGDVVSGMIAAARRGRIGERYILAGDNLTHKEIFQRTASLIGGLSPFAKMPLPFLRFLAGAAETAGTMLRVQPILTPALISGAGRHNWYSNEKARQDLDMKVTPFEEAVRRAFSWYRQRHML